VPTQTDYSNEAGGQARRHGAASKVSGMAADLGRQARREIKQTRDNVIRRMQLNATAYLSSAAQAIRTGGAQMRQDGHDATAHALDRAASTVQEVGVELSSQDLVQAGAQIVTIAKRRPAVTLGVFAGAGFLLAFSMRKSGGRRPLRPSD